MLTSFTSPHTPAPAGPYSPALAYGGLVFLAGQGPFNAAGERVGDTFADQTRQTLRNLQAAAEAAGTSLQHAVRIGVYLKDLADFAEMNEITKEFLTAPYPARTTLRVGLSGFDIEIDAIVALPQHSDQAS